MFPTTQPINRSTAQPLNQAPEPTTTITPSSLPLKKNGGKRLTSIAGLYEEELFNDLLRVEERRTERSRRPFLLMLVDLQYQDPQEEEKVARQIATTLFSTSRETDVKGWYKRTSIIGIIFTDPNPDNDITCFQDIIFDKVCGRIKSVVGLGRFNKLEIKLHVFPQNPLAISSSVGKSKKECQDLTAKDEHMTSLLSSSTS